MLPKSVGGLGFKEIEQFDDALHAKLTWRIIKHPTSLIAQILMSKYGKSSSFMELTLPRNDSHPRLVKCTNRKRGFEKRDGMDRE